MFSDGILDLDGVQVSYSVKHYPKGSKWGIDGGKISKMECRVDGRTILRYDRGWDMEPESELGYLAYSSLIHNFN